MKGYLLAALLLTAIGLLYILRPQWILNGLRALPKPLSTVMLYHVTRQGMDPSSDDARKQYRVLGGAALIVALLAMIQYLTHGMR